MQTRRRHWWRSRWCTPLSSLALGALVLAAMAVGGNAADGLKAFGVMAAVAAVFALGGRSDTLGGLGGPARDERWAMIDLRATAFAGLVLVAVLTGGWLWKLSRGDDGSPYGQLLAVGGVAYLLAVALGRWRG